MDEKGRAPHRTEGAPTPSAPIAPSADSDADAGFEQEIEQLANPERSLFEGADPQLAGVHRGSALSLVSGAASGIGTALGVSLIAIVQVLGGSTPDNLPGIFAFAALLIVGSVVGSVVSWRTRTWELTDAGIMLRHGLVTAKQLQVPYEHIHTVNMSSSLMERLFGLMTLDLDTGAADSEGEATRITGLQAGLAQALRDELFRRKAAVLSERPAGDSETGAPGTAGEAAGDAFAPGASGSAPDACFTLTRGQLVVAALTETRIVAQAVAFLILIVQGINFLQESRLVNLSEAAGSVAALPMGLLVGSAVLLLALSIVVGFAVSFVFSLIGFAGYRAERTGGRISVERGLLNHTSHMVALERIQSISIDQGLIRQVMGYAEVRASVVGSIGSADETSSSDGVVLHPFIRVSDVDAFLEAIAPECAGALAASHMLRLPPAAARRLAFRTVVRALLLAAVIAGALFCAERMLPAGGAWDVLGTALRVLLCAVGAVVVVRMAIGAVLRYRDSRVGHDRARLVAIVGGIKRRTQVVPRSRLQHATASASPFQRRLQLETFTTKTAAAGDVVLRDFTAADVESLLAWVRPHPVRCETL